MDYSISRSPGALGSLGFPETSSFALAPSGRCYSPIAELQVSCDTSRVAAGQQESCAAGKYQFPFQRRTRSVSPPKDAFINSKISEALCPNGLVERQGSNGSLLLEKETPKTKPVVANTNFFFIGGFDSVFETSHSAGGLKPQGSSIFGDRQMLSPKL